MKQVKIIIIVIITLVGARFTLQLVQAQSQIVYLSLSSVSFIQNSASFSCQVLPAAAAAALMEQQFFQRQLADGESEESD